MKSSRMRGRKSLRSIEAFFSLALLLIFLASCSPGGGGSGSTEVVFWEPDIATWQPTYQTLANMFMKSHPNIKVKVVNIPEDGYVEKLNTAFAAGRGPDMWVGEYAIDEYQRGYIQPLDSFIEKDHWDMNQYFQPGVNNRARGSDGKYYGLPRDISMSTVLYNKDLFDKYKVPYPKPDWTLDDLRRTAKALTHAADKVYGTDMTHELYETPLPWNYGVDLFSDDGWTAKGYLDSPQMIEYITTIQNMVKDGSVVPSKMLDTMNGDYPAFTAGTAAMSHGTLWGYDTLKKVNFHWGVVPYPKGENQYSWVDSVPYHMNARSKHQQETWEFMKFMSGPEAGKQLMELGTWASPVKSAWTDTGKDKDEKLSVYFAEGAKQSKLANYLRNSEDFHLVWGGPLDDIFNDILDPVGGKPMADPATRLKQAAQQIQADLDQAKSKLKPR